MTKCFAGVDLHFATLEPVVYDDAWRELHGGNATARSAAGCHAVRLVVCRQCPVPIGSVWPVMDSDFVALQAKQVGRLLSACRHGLGILILSDDRTRRDEAKAFLRALAAVAPGAML
jgi:hypothetical protein